jgi:hypothetical protein
LWPNAKAKLTGAACKDVEARKTRLDDITSIPVRRQICVINIVGKHQPWVFCVVTKRDDHYSNST